MCARHGPKPGAQGSPVRINQRCAAPRAVWRVAAHLRLTAYAAGTMSYLFSTGAVTCCGRVPAVNLRFLCRLFGGSREKNTRSETDFFSHPPLLDFRGTYIHTRTSWPPRNTNIFLPAFVTRILTPGHENPAMGFFWGVDHH